MGLLRIIKCDRMECTSTMQEAGVGEGFTGWGGVNGVTKAGAEIMLCPQCLKDICDFIDPEEADR